MLGGGVGTRRARPSPASSWCPSWRGSKAPAGSRRSGSRRSTPWSARGRRPGRPRAHPGGPGRPAAPGGRSPCPPAAPAPAPRSGRCWCGRRSRPWTPCARVRVAARACSATWPRVGLEEVGDGTFFRLDGRGRGAGAGLPGARGERRGPGRARCASGSASWRSAPAPGLRLEVVADRSREVVAALRRAGARAPWSASLLGAAVLRVLPRPLAADARPWRWWCRPRCSPPSPASTSRAPRSTWSRSPAWPWPPACWWTARSWSWRRSRPPAPGRARARPSTGTRQIALPVIASFLTTAVVFLPLIYLQGLARAFFGVQAFAIVASLAASLLFSLTVTPVLSGNAGRPSRRTSGRSPGRRAYLRLLDAALARPALRCWPGSPRPPWRCSPWPSCRASWCRTRRPDGAGGALPPGARTWRRRRPGAWGERGGTAAAARPGPPPGWRSSSPRTAASGAPGGDRAARPLLPRPDAAGRARSLAAVRSLAAAGRRGLGRAPDERLRGADRAGRPAAGGAWRPAATPERAADLAGRAASGWRDAGLREVAGAANRPQPALLLSWDAPAWPSWAPTAAAWRSRSGRGSASRPPAGCASDGGRARDPGRGRRSQDPALLPVVRRPGRQLRSRPLARPGPASLPAPGRRSWSGRTAAPPCGSRSRARPRSGERCWPACRRPTSGRPGRPGAGAEPRLLPAPAGPGPLAAPGLPDRGGALRVVPAAAGRHGHRAGGPRRRARAARRHRPEPQRPLLPGPDPARRHRGEQRDRPGPPHPGARGARASRWTRPSAPRPGALPADPDDHATTLAGMLPLALLGGEGVELRRSLAIAVIGGMVTSTFASLLLVPVLYRRALQGRRAA